MAITLLQPFNLDSTKDYTFNNASISTVLVTSSTQSSNSTTGALVVSGGVGIAGNLNVATNLTVEALSNLGNIGNVYITGGASGQFLRTDGSGNLTWATVNSSVIFNGSSNVNIPSANGNISLSVNSTSNVVVVTTSGTITNGSTTSNTFVSTATTGTAPLTINSATRVANLNVSYANVSDYSNVITQTTGVFYPTFISDTVSGNYQLGANANITYNAGTHTLSTSYFTGVLTTQNQPNITSVGQLANLKVTANIDAGNVNVANSLYVTGNVYAPYFVGDVSGNVSGNISGNITVPGANAEVLFNTGNVLDASDAFKFYKDTNVLSVSNSIQANYISAGVNVTATGNIIGGNISTGGMLTVTGNATFNGNLIVNGTTIYANTTTLTIKDPIITTGGDVSGAPLTNNDGKDRGIILKYHDGVNPVDAFMGWDNSNAEFMFGKNTSVSGEVISINEFGNVRANNFYGNFNGVLSGNVSGNISGNIGLPSGNNTQVIYNDSGTASSSVNFTFNKSTNVLTVTGNITSNNANLGNLATANYVTGTLTTQSQPNITSVGTLANLDVTGNITASNANLGNLVTANYFTGNGYLLSNLNVANIGTVANANYAAYAGNITIGNQPNITATGTLTSLTISGNVTAGNANLGNLATANFVTGTLTTNAQPNITSVGTLANLTVSGNLRFNTGLSANGNFGTIGQVLTAKGDNTAYWSSQFYTGNLPPQLQIPAISPNYGDIWYYIDNLANPPVEKLYMWVTDGTSSYYYDFLPPSG